MNINFKKFLSKFGSFMMGLLLIGTGILFLYYNSIAFNILIIMVGIVYFVYGCFDLFSLKDIEPSFKTWVLTHTLFEMILGLVMIILPWFVTDVIGLVMGVLLISYSTGLIVETCVYRPKGFIAKVLLYSLVTLLFGILFVFDPSEFGRTFMLIIAGVSILAGVILCVVAITLSKKAKIISQEEIEENIDTYEQEEKQETKEDENEDNSSSNESQEDDE